MRVVALQPIDIKHVTSYAFERHGLDADRLGTFLGQILRWNDQLGLVSRRSIDDVLRRLIDQSAALWQVVVETSASTPRRVADVGSGAGFPGVVCKLLSPETFFLLIERRAKKAHFLERLAPVLHIDGLEAFGGEAAAAARHPDFIHTFDAVLSSAVARPAALAAEVRQLLTPTGVYATIRPRGDEATAVPGGFELAGRRDLPAGSAVVYHQVPVGTDDPGAGI